MVGAGVIGCAVAREIAQRRPRLKITLLEKEDGPARHTSGHNSGVIHPGYHTKPGTLKAKMCAEGARRLREYCRNRRVPMQECGAIVLAVETQEEAGLEEWIRRGAANGVEGLRRLSRRELAEKEPNARPGEALFAPTGAIVDSSAYVASLLEECRRAGVEFRPDSPVRKAAEEGNGARIWTGGDEIRARLFVNCAGLYADRISHMFGVGREYRIAPFRGEYRIVRREKRDMVRSMLYPVPDPEVPYLGVHFTRRVNGDLFVGPNAVLALSREAYTWMPRNLREFAEIALNLPLWRALMRPPVPRMACRELMGSLFKRFFCGMARRLVPALRADDLTGVFSGVRAQLVHCSGRLIEDFVVEFSPRSVHVLNAVSPGLTSSLAFAEHVVNLMEEKGLLS